MCRNALNAITRWHQFNRILKGPGVVIPLIFPRNPRNLPQGSTPSLWTPPTLRTPKKHPTVEKHRRSLGRENAAVC